MQVQVAYEIHKWIILPLRTEIRLEVLSEASNGRLSSLLFLYLRLFLALTIEFLSFGNFHFQQYLETMPVIHLYRFGLIFSDMWKVL